MAMGYLNHSNRLSSTLVQRVHQKN